MIQNDLSDLKNKKTALVLSGGVVKAASWHLGVALALEDLGFHFTNNNETTDSQFLEKKSLKIDTYVGSSAGAMISIFLASGFSAQEVINGALGFKKSRISKITYKDMFFLSKKPKRSKSSKFNLLDGYPKILQSTVSPLLNFSGFFSTEGVKRYLLKNVLAVNRFEEFKPDLFVVGTQLDHSRKVIFSKYNYPNPRHDNTAAYYTDISVADAAAASMAVPPFYAPYPIENPRTNKTDYYIDGEIRETLSTHVAEDNGCEVIISSWTHTPLHYQEAVGSLVNYGIPQIIIQSIYLLIQKKIVASRARRATALDIMDTVTNYLKDEKFDQKHINEIQNILEKKLDVRKNVKLIDIAPDHDDYELFFANSFSLNPKNAAHTVKAAYKKTMKVLGQKI